MSVSFEFLLDEFSARTTLIRRWLISSGGHVNGVFGDESAANARAFAIVWMSSATEQFWVGILECACACVRQFSSVAARRRMRSQAIFFIEAFPIRGTKELTSRWDRSFELIRDFVEKPRTDLKFSLPYDGKTVKPAHVDLIWKLFELQGMPFPSIIHRQSLETLAVDRNLVAHGEQAPGTLGRLRTKEDVHQTLSRLEETMEHVLLGLRGAVTQK
jgi:hypothetical protein